MKNKQYYYFSIITLIIGLIFTFIFYLRRNHEFIIEKKSCTNRTSILYDEIKRQKQNIELELNNNYYIIDDFFLFDRNGGKHSFFDVVKGFSIILRKTDFSCNDCFEEITNIIQDNSIINKSNILVILPFEEESELVFYSNQYRLQDFRVFGSSKTCLSNLLDNGNETYFFTINNDHVLKDLFIANINNKNSIKSYISMLERSSLFNSGGKIATQH